jgi:hypothetical protein
MGGYIYFFNFFSLESIASLMMDSEIQLAATGYPNPGIRRHEIIMCTLISNSDPLEAH